VKLNLKNYQSNELILLLFSWLYSAAIFWELHRDTAFHMNSINPSCGIMTASLGVHPNGIYYLLLALIPLSLLLQHRFAWLWGVCAALYFICLRDFVICQSGPERIYMAWNHAIVFWVFLAMSTQKILGAAKTVTLIKFLLLISYFAGGIAKVRHGLEWMNGWTLQYYFLQRHIDLNTPLAVEMVSNLQTAKILSWLVVLPEILVPLAFLNKRLEWVFVISFFIFQIICWYVLKLKWMHYYGWTYLIYFSMVLVWLFQKSRQRKSLL
jgi:hypothetical protein